jgi:hypothetical protein
MRIRWNGCGSFSFQNGSLLLLMRFCSLRKLLRQAIFPEAPSNTVETMQKDLPYALRGLTMAGEDGVNDSALITLSCVTRDIGA